MIDREKLTRWIETHTDEMLADFQRLLRAESIESDPLPNAPFGQGVREALDVVINLGNRFGFKVKDFEGYAAHLEIGEGDGMIASLSHVDVVPIGNLDNWTYPPFGAEIHDGYIYARGAEDDKGATLASIYAVRALKELGVPLKRRVRLIIGCDEESGFECMHYYTAHEPERPLYGVSPDAGWPFIYAEKGILTFYLEKPIDLPDNAPRILSLNGGDRPNMVPDRAEAILTLQGYELPMLQEGQGITLQEVPEGTKVIAQGKASHGARPSDGINAVTKLLQALQPLGLPDNNLWLNTVAAWSEALDGSALGIAHRDDVSGELTSNMGILHYDGTTVKCVFNIRYPVTWTLDALMERLKPTVESAGFSIVHTHHSAPLYVPQDTPFLQTILAVYQEETGDTEKQPGTMGGGTYARVMPNLVAIGAGFDGDGPAHEPDERIAVDTMKKLCRIYAQTFARLANL